MGQIPRWQAIGPATIQEVVLFYESLRVLWPTTFTSGWPPIRILPPTHLAHFMACYFLSSIQCFHSVYVCFFQVVCFLHFPPPTPRISLLLQNFQIISGGHPAFCSMVTGLKAAGEWFRSLTSNADVKNERYYNSTPSICFHDVCKDVILTQIRATCPDPLLLHYLYE